LLLGLDAPKGKICGRVYNLGTPEGNCTKDQIITLVLKRLPETSVHYKDMTFGGDMRDITVSFDKIQREFDFSARLTVDDGTEDSPGFAAG
jgi:nucleoside-diphosphate-sugar epimerase